MIRPQYFYDSLVANGIDFFTGVPDSLLKDVCAYITDHTDSKKNIIAANEGNAVGLAAGYYLASKKIGMVYLQNSGLGNAMNPLLSLADPAVYSIPVLLLVGWRGEPDTKDEPQHIQQGLVTLDLLEAMGIPYEVLSENETNLDASIQRALDYMTISKGPYALVVRKNTFAEYKLLEKSNSSFEMNREGALEHIVAGIKEDSIIVSTTGKTSRELFELRKKLGQSHERDFLTVGSMGHSLSIATEIALMHPNRDVYCIDGDGSFIMHMGGLAITASLAPPNLKHIVINNGAHDSVGGQPTVGFQIDICAIAKACGYKKVFYADSISDLKLALIKLISTEELAILEIRTSKGARKDLGRPTTSPCDNKDAFMRSLSSNTR